MKVARYEVPGTGEMADPSREGRLKPYRAMDLLVPPIRRHQQHHDQASRRRVSDFARWTNDRLSQRRSRDSG